MGRQTFPLFSQLTSWTASAARAIEVMSIPQEQLLERNALPPQNLFSVRGGRRAWARTTRPLERD